MNEGELGYMTPGLKRQRQQLNNSSPLAKRLGPNGNVGLGDLIDRPINMMLISLTGILPSATINTFGATTVITPDSGWSYMVPLRALITVNPIGSETVTLNLVATYDDGSQSSVVAPTFTSNTPAELTFAQLQSLFKAGGRSIASIAVTAKSSIGTSTASIAIVLLGYEYGQLA